VVTFSQRETIQFQMISKETAISVGLRLGLLYKIQREESIDRRSICTSEKRLCWVPPGPDSRDLGCLRG